MGFWDWIRRRRPEGPSLDRAMVPPAYHYGAFRKGISATDQQPTARQLLVDGYAQTQAIAARAVSNRVSDLSLEMQQRETNDEGEPVWATDKVHPFLQVLRNPNPYLSERQYLKLTSYWLTQTGEAFWLIVTDGTGRARELWPLAPSHVEKVSSDIQPVAGFVFHGEQGEVSYRLEEVIWIYDPDPADPFQGVGVLGPQAREFDSMTFASSTMRTHFQQDAVPKVVLTASEEADSPDREQKEQFWADWQNRYNRRHGENVGVPAFLPSGFGIHELGGMADMDGIRQFLEYERDTLFMANGVPRSILGDVVDANRAAADTNRLVFDRHTIEPQTGLIADAMTQQLVRPQFGDDWRVAFEDFIDEDADLRLREEGQDLNLKVRSVNQVRADRGLDSVDWGDDPVGTFGDTPYDPDGDDGGGGGGNPFMMEPGGNESPPPEEGPEEDDSEDDERAVTRPFIARAVHPRIAARLNAESSWARVMATDAEWIPRMTREVRRAFAIQKEMVIQALRDAPVGERSHSRQDWLDELINAGDFGRVFDTIVTPLSVSIYSVTGEQTLAALEEVPRLEFQDQALKEMRAQGAALVAYTTDTTRSQLRRTLEQGIEQGEGLDQLEKRVRDTYRGISRGRARTIARTEVGYAMSKGQLAAWEQSEVVFLTQWNTARDERVRDQHVSMEGVQVREGQTFYIPPSSNGPGERALAPRIAADGGRLLPHNGINCRCFDTPVLGD